MFRLLILLLAITMIPDGGCGKPEVEKKPAEAKEEKAAEAEKTMERVGPGLAVEGYETTGRIKLSEKAVKRLGLSTNKATVSEGAVWIGVEAIVDEKGQSFVYVQEPDNWMKRVPVKVGPRSGSRIPVLFGLTPGTAYVEKGAPLVRLAELDLVSVEDVD